ncbi:MAG: hypothetical protein H6621_09580 [Halobacteriovoraceae bacterium]|nr:hypothetical protein [Halobacteriovoraceae bacterium]MCB9095307.1 hypothetical protein [Halobacteriovoraceae bacterium]
MGKKLKSIAFILLFIISVQNVFSNPIDKAFQYKVGESCDVNVDPYADDYVTMRESTKEFDRIDKKMTKLKKCDAYFSDVATAAIFIIPAIFMKVVLPQYNSFFSCASKYFLSFLALTPFYGFWTGKFNFKKANGFILSPLLDDNYGFLRKVWSRYEEELDELRKIKRNAADDALNYGGYEYPYSSNQEKNKNILIAKKRALLLNSHLRNKYDYIDKDEIDLFKNKIGKEVLIRQLEIVENSREKTVRMVNNTKDYLIRGIIDRVEGNELVLRSTDFSNPTEQRVSFNRFTMNFFFKNERTNLNLRSIEKIPELKSLKNLTATLSKVTVNDEGIMKSENQLIHIISYQDNVLKYYNVEDYSSLSYTIRNKGYIEKKLTDEDFLSLDLLHPSYETQKKVIEEMNKTLGDELITQDEIIKDFEKADPLILEDLKTEIDNPELLKEIENQMENREKVYRENSEEDNNPYYLHFFND